MANQSYYVSSNQRTLARIDTILNIFQSNWQKRLKNKTLLSATGRRMNTVINLYIGNLALADVIIALLCIPFQFQAALLHRWDLPSFLCKLCPFVQVRWNLRKIEISKVRSNSKIKLLNFFFENKKRKCQTLNRKKEVKICWFLLAGK